MERAQLRHRNQFPVFWGRLMSHSRSNNFTYIFLTGKGGEWKKKAFLPYVIFPWRGKPLCYNVGTIWLRQRVETGPPPSLPLVLKRSSFSVTKPDHYFLLIDKSPVCISQLWAAPGELRGNSPLFLITACAEKKILDLFWWNSVC